MIHSSCLFQNLLRTYLGPGKSYVEYISANKNLAFKVTLSVFDCDVIYLSNNKHEMTKIVQICASQSWTRSHLDRWSLEYKILKGNSVLHLGVFASVRGYYSIYDRSFLKLFVSPQVAAWSHINLDRSYVHSDSAVPEDGASRSYQIYHLSGPEGLCDGVLC